MSTSFTPYIVRLSTLLWFGSCNHSILACFLWSKNRKHSSSNHGLCCFNSQRPRLPLPEVLISSWMFYQALNMSSLLFKFSRTAVLFEILTWYGFLTSSSLIFLRLNVSTSNRCFLFTYCQSFPNFCNHQTVLSITVSSSERSYIEYTGIPSAIYQYVVNLVFSVPMRRCPGLFMNVSVREHRSLNT